MRSIIKIDLVHGWFHPESMHKFGQFLLDRGVDIRYVGYDSHMPKFWRVAQVKKGIRSDSVAHIGHSMGGIILETLFPTRRLYSFWKKENTSGKVFSINSGLRGDSGITTIQDENDPLFGKLAFIASFTYKGNGHSVKSLKAYEAILHALLVRGAITEEYITPLLDESRPHEHIGDSIFYEDGEVVYVDSWANADAMEDAFDRAHNSRSD